MKVRVKYYSGYYYPQVKKFIFWHYTQQGNNIACFRSEEAAKKFLAGDFLYNDKVTWVGEV